MWKALTCAYCGTQLPEVPDLPQFFAHVEHVVITCATRDKPGLLPGTVCVRS